MSSSQFCDIISLVISMSQFSIKQIFQDNWSNFLSDNPHIFIRPSVFQEVNKIIHCGNPAFGHAIYICECCHKIISVPFRCKSRFCNTCGTKYAQDRALSMSKKAIRCEHRHIVFTMSDKLWPFFQKDTTLLNGLFEAASQAVLSWFHELSKSQNFIPRHYVHPSHFRTWPKMEPSYPHALHRREALVTLKFLEKSNILVIKLFVVDGKN